MSALVFSFKSFEQLDNVELYEILRLRNEVFVVEQKCIFQDADNKDQQSMHLLCKKRGELIAYCRLVLAGISYTEMSIGRVVCKANERKSGVGTQLMTRAIETIYAAFGKGPIKIGAQLYLQHFYEKFGFKRVSEVYWEDGIEHIEMLLHELI